jgi:hypothetical protein
MKDKFSFRAFYYINNVAFSFLFLFTTVATISFVYGIFQKLGIATNSSFLANINFNSIIQWLSGLGLTICVYQIFLALYSVKQNRYSNYYWTKKFNRCGSILLLLAVINLITVAEKSQKGLFWIEYATETAVYGISNVPVMYLFGGACAYFISNLQPQTK